MMKRILFGMLFAAMTYIFVVGHDLNLRPLIGDLFALIVAAGYLAFYCYAFYGMLPKKIQDKLIDTEFEDCPNPYYEGKDNE